MRAKTINEIQNFKRGVSPKVSMGTSDGLVLRDEATKRIEELNIEIEHVKNKYNTDWENYLRELLIGKTITAELKKMPMYDSKTMVQKSKSEKGQFTITVADLSCEKIEEYDMYKEPILADTEGNLYSLPVNSKIYFE